jgi:hypothetical protein
MKKLYRVRNKKTGKFIALGYERKTSWLVFPSEVIKNNRHFSFPDGEENYEVVMFEMQPTKKFTLDKKEIPQNQNLSDYREYLGVL